MRPSACPSGRRLPPLVTTAAAATSLLLLSLPALCSAQQDAASNASSYITRPDLTPLYLNISFPASPSVAAASLKNASIISSSTNSSSSSSSGNTDAAQARSGQDLGLGPQGAAAAAVSIDPNNYLLLTPRSQSSTSGSTVGGLHIVNSVTGSPVYINQDAWLTQNGSSVLDLNMHMYGGKPVLGFWVGQEQQGKDFGFGTNYLLNQSYGVIANLTAGPSGSSYQDFRLTSNDTALLLTYELASGKDTSSIGSTGATNSTIYDGCFHEVALPAGNDLFSWCASQHGVAFNESYVTPSVSPNSQQNTWDWFHPTAISKDAAGNYLFSGRNTKSVYYVASNGTVLWRLGGKNSSFTGNGTQFSYQNDVSFIAAPAELMQPSSSSAEVDAASVMAANLNGTRFLTLLDNAATSAQSDGSQSRDMLISLDMSNMTATALRTFSAPAGMTGLLDINGGNIQAINVTATATAVNSTATSSVLSTATTSSSADAASSTASATTTTNTTHYLLSYGNLPYIAEYNSSGTAVSLIAIGENQAANITSLKAYKQAWVGTPLDAPSVNFQNGTVYASWNGATETRYWRLVVYPSDQTALTFNHTSFETSYNLSASLANFGAASAANSTMLQLVAVDTANQELARTGTFYLINGTMTDIGRVNGTSNSASSRFLTTGAPILPVGLAGLLLSVVLGASIAFVW